MFYCCAFECLQFIQKLYNFTRFEHVIRVINSLYLRCLYEMFGINERLIVCNRSNECDSCIDITCRLQVFFICVDTYLNCHWIYASSLVKMQLLLGCQSGRQNSLIKIEIVGDNLIELNILHRFSSNNFFFHPFYLLTYLVIQIWLD